MVLTVLSIIFLGTRQTALSKDNGSGDRQQSKNAICKVFGDYCRQALRVSWCESRWYRQARNGQYLGLFQMGSWERATYGHGKDALTQAQAAFRYFVVSGKDWSPWTCKPW